MLPSSFAKYNQVVKRNLGSSLRPIESGSSQNVVAKACHMSCIVDGVNVHPRTCKRRESQLHIIGVVKGPERVGGTSLPYFDLELRVAYMIRKLRLINFPVFPNYVMFWASELIVGTPYATSFPNGQTTRGWYYGFLERHSLVIWTMRPLESTRHEWLFEKKNSLHVMMSRLTSC